MRRWRVKVVRKVEEWWIVEADDSREARAKAFRAEGTQVLAPEIKGIMGRVWLEETARMMQAGDERESGG